MALTPIKGTLLNLDDVFVTTEDGVRYVTDRFTLWRLDELAGRSKLHAALAAVVDGCYAMTAGGAVKPHGMFSQVPAVGRLIPEDNGGDELEPLPMTFDYKESGLRLWAAQSGDPVALDARVRVDGFLVRRHVSGAGNKPASVMTPRGEFAGLLMPVRSEVALTNLTEVARRLGIAPAPINT